MNLHSAYSYNSRGSGQPVTRHSPLHKQQRCTAEGSAQVSGCPGQGTGTKNHCGPQTEGGGQTRPQLQDGLALSLEHSETGTRTQLRFLESVIHFRDSAPALPSEARAI